MSDSKDLTRRNALKVAGAASAAVGPLIRTAKAATNSVQYGMVGTGSRGTYLLKHLKSIDTGKCVAICDIIDDALKQGRSDHRRNAEEVQGLPRTAGRQGRRSRLRHHPACSCISR